MRFQVKLVLKDVRCSRVNEGFTVGTRVQQGIGCEHEVMIHQLYSLHEGLTAGEAATWVWI